MSGVHYFERLSGFSPLMRGIK
ncbi:hypothetical protein EMIT0158MI4_50421 [Burkholderia ambifaria]